MKIVVYNIGSSSLKFQLLEMSTETLLASGHAERVGSQGSTFTCSAMDRQTYAGRLPMPGHREAVQQMLDFLIDKRFGALTSLADIAAVGFKTIQAGEKNGSVLLSQDVLDAMEYYRNLAPAHNPPYLNAIYMFRELLPDTPLVGVFEPGFHVDAPQHAKIYGTPYDWITDYGVRKYGYHGASHRFVTGETVRRLNLPADDHRIITCHLGGSSSLCAFKNGKSIDSSMGFTPQSGLIQGTRIGDMDPYVLPYIMDKKGITLAEALRECSSSAGLAGLSGTSGDMRDINTAIAAGDQRAALARRKFIYDIQHYIGAYLVLLQGLDAVTFTGGIGQKDAGLRKELLDSLAFLGMRVDENRNSAHHEVISADDSSIKALVLVTNEEIVVARETLAVITNL
jgi:acetate kinase